MASNFSASKGLQYSAIHRPQPFDLKWPQPFGHFLASTFWPPINFLVSRGLNCSALHWPQLFGHLASTIWPLGLMYSAIQPQKYPAIRPRKYLAIRPRLFGHSAWKIFSCSASTARLPWPHKHLAKSGLKCSACTVRPQRNPDRQYQRSATIDLHNTLLTQDQKAYPSRSTKVQTKTKTNQRTCIYQELHN